MIFYDSVNRASQTQEFRNQRDSEPGRRKTRILNNSLWRYRKILNEEKIDYKEEFNYTSLQKK